MKVFKIVSTVVLFGFAAVVSAQTVPGLTVSVTAPDSVPTGTARTLATVTLMGGSQAATVAALPLSMGYAAQTGVITSAAPLTNCKLQNAAGTALNTGSNAITSSVGSQDINVTFDQALSVPATGVVALSFVCDVPVTVPNGSAVAVAIFPNTVSAQTAASTSVAVAGVNVGTTGAVMGVTTISSATAGMPDTGGSTPPGTPDTGAGGSAAMTWFVLALSAAVALGAGTYTYRTRKA